VRPDVWPLALLTLEVLGEDRSCDSVWSDRRLCLAGPLPLLLFTVRQSGTCRSMPHHIARPHGSALLHPLRILCETRSWASMSSNRRVCLAGPLNLYDFTPFTTRQSGMCRSTPNDTACAATLCCHKDTFPAAWSFLCCLQQW